MFGDALPGVRYYFELGWAKTSDDESDAFGAAYPYTNRVQVIEAYAERLQDAVRSIRALDRSNSSVCNHRHRVPAWHSH